MIQQAINCQHFHARSRVNSKQEPSKCNALALTAYGRWTFSETEYPNEAVGMAILLRPS
jgi:hypothetical protein